ncbi:hypothetical protein [Flavobacterium psychrophilum]|uniref:hypothetical protein n=1 Tax=Flavobacterium psychrophilum TaxID=96345 RepID=UPI001D069BCF|nr:hypothetical protein [Flavobacterium psychrophilum]MCB6098449.1 hypothetical protein [Flavobacterium psychrophilum]
MRIFYLLIMILVLTTSCNSEGHYHDGIYKNSYFGGDREIILNGNNAKMISSITGTTESKVKQFENRIEYVEANGNTSIYYILDNGDLKINEYVIFHKMKSNNEQTN